MTYHKIEMSRNESKSPEDDDDDDDDDEEEERKSVNLLSSSFEEEEEEEEEEEQEEEEEGKSTIWLVTPKVASLPKSTDEDDTEDGVVAVASVLLNCPGRDCKSEIKMGLTLKDEPSRYEKDKSEESAFFKVNQNKVYEDRIMKAQSFDVVSKIHCPTCQQLIILKTALFPTFVDCKQYKRQKKE